MENINLLQSFFIKMEMYIMGNINYLLKRAQENLLLLMELFTKVDGKMTEKVAKGD